MTPREQVWADSLSSTAIAAFTSAPTVGPSHPQRISASIHSGRTSGVRSLQKALQFSPQVWSAGLEHDLGHPA